MEKVVYKVKVIGISPYLQDQMHNQKLIDFEDGKEQKIVQPKHKKQTPMQKALEGAYYDIDKTTGERLFYIPSDHFKQCLINGGNGVKAPVGNMKRSLVNVVAGEWRIFPKKMFCLSSDFKISEIAAWNAKAHARIMKYRPMWEKWSAEFFIQIYNNSMTLTQIKEVFEHAGIRNGIGSYRVQHKGEYGMFELASIEELSQKAQKEFDMALMGI